MKNKMSLIAAILAGGLLAAAGYAKSNAPAKIESFNAEQRVQIEQIVHDYLLKNPDILIEVSQVLQQRQQTEMQMMQKKAIDFVKGHIKEVFFDPNSPTVGNPKGDVSIVEFMDYRCGHCRAMGPVLEDIVKNDAGVRLAYKEFVIFGDESEFAAKAALAANMQGKFKEFNHGLIEAKSLNQDEVLNVAKSVGLEVVKLKTDMQSKEVLQQLRNDFKLAEDLKLKGTPALIIGSHLEDPEKARIIVIPGQVDGGMLKNLVEAVRKAEPEKKEEEKE